MTVRHWQSFADVSERFVDHIFKVPDAKVYWILKCKVWNFKPSKMRYLLPRNFGNCLPAMQIHILEGQNLPLRHTGEDIRQQETLTTIFTAVRKSLCAEQIIFDQVNIFVTTNLNIQNLCQERGKGSEKRERKSSVQVFSLPVYRRLHKKL